MKLPTAKEAARFAMKALESLVVDDKPKPKPKKKTDSKKKKK